MILGFPYIYYHGPDKSKLFRAWEKYYDGLSYNKKLKKVHERVRKGKFPNPSGKQTKP